MNQVIIAYHVAARGEIRLSPELAEYKLFAPTEVRLLAGRHRPRAGRLAALARHRAAVVRAGQYGKRAIEFARRTEGRPMEAQQGTRHPRPELPAADPEGQEGAGRDASGDVLKVVATDPGSVRDFQAFARQTGNELLEQSSAGDEFIHFLRRR